MPGLFYESVLQALAAAGVRFVVVGGVAVILHGVPRTTADLDIVADLDRENLLGLVEVLLGLGFRPRAPVDARRLAEPEERRRWSEEKGLKAFSFHRADRPLDAVDVLLDSPVPYEQLARGSVTIQADSLHLRIAAVEDLVAMKLAAGRAQDFADADALRRLMGANDELT